MQRGALLRTTQWRTVCQYPLAHSSLPGCDNSAQSSTQTALRAGFLVHGRPMLERAPLLPLMWWMSTGGVMALLFMPFIIILSLLCRVWTDTAICLWCAHQGRHGAVSKSSGS